MLEAAGARDSEGLDGGGYEVAHRYVCFRGACDGDLLRGVLRSEESAVGTGSDAGACGTAVDAAVDSCTGACPACGNNTAGRNSAGSSTAARGNAACWWRSSSRR